MKTSSKIWIALGSGLALGSIAGILFAPNKGTETRKKIAGAGTKISDQLKDKVQQSKDRILAFKEDIKERIEALNEKVDNIL